MLVLTQQAREVISVLVDKPELPEGAGLRIAASGNGDQPLAVTTSASPDATDRVVEDEGARVFLDLGAAEMLDDKVLDARVDGQGSVQFLLAAQ